MDMKYEYAYIYLNVHNLLVLREVILLFTENTTNRSAKIFLRNTFLPTRRDMIYTPPVVTRVCIYVCIPT